MWDTAPGERPPCPAAGFWLRRGPITALAVLVLAVALAAVAPPLATSVEAAASGFVPLPPARVLDTRSSSPVAGGASITVSLAGHVPPGATAVALNVTATRATSDTFLTVWPGGTRPVASNVNVTRGATRANSVMVGLGRGQTISIFNDRGSADVVIDLMGAFTHGFTGVRPVRLMDTRNGLGGTRFGPATTQAVRVRGVHGVPADAVAVAVNITAIKPTVATFVTAWPSSTRPSVSNVNATPGTTVPNLAVVGIGADHQIRLYNDHGQVDVAVDLMGWFDASGGLVPLSPYRALDTRQNTCGVRLGPGETRTLRITSRTDRSGAVVNVTAVGSTQPTFVTVWPTGQPRPQTSNLNVTSSAPAANLVKVGLGEQGQINLYNDRGTTHLLVDLYATTAGATPEGARVACPEPPPVTADELLLRPDLQEMVGHDSVGVWVCDVPVSSTHDSYRGSTRLTVDARSVADWANTNVSPYFAEVSGGRYRASFMALGRISLPAGAGPSDCRHAAAARTEAPYTNVLAVDNTSLRNGVSSVGTLSARTDLREASPLPPSRTGRSMWVGGGSIVSTPSAAVVAHEIGHTLHWPHSTAGTSSYDNWIDLMSGWPRASWCTGTTSLWPCHPQHTLAVNRLAAGWIDDHELGVHRAGTSVTLLSPPGSGGVQLLAIPADGDTPAFVTAEARPATGVDRHLDKEGVALHLVDQRDTGCWTQAVGGCISTTRHQAALVPSTDGRAHVLGAGETLSAHGLTITVLRRFGDLFEVSVTGTFRPPPR